MSRSSFRHFLDRELVTLLAESPHWRLRGRPWAASGWPTTRSSPSWSCPPRAAPPLRLTFQQRGGWIVAALPQRGWLDAVDEDQAKTFLDALRGQFRLAGVDLIWEQVAARFGPDVYWYDIDAAGLGAVAQQPVCVGRVAPASRRAGDESLVAAAHRPRRAASGARRVVPGPLAARLERVGGTLDA